MEKNSWIGVWLVFSMWAVYKDNGIFAFLLKQGGKETRPPSSLDTLKWKVQSNPEKPKVLKH